MTKWLFLFDGGYSSSIEAANLRDIEKKVATLHSPLWPDFFPKIDQAKAKEGRALYESHCLSCHQDIDRTDPNRKVKARMSTIDEMKTDPWMAKNALEHKGKKRCVKLISFYANAFTVHKKCNHSEVVWALVLKYMLLLV